MWRRPYSCAELALGHGRAGGDSQRQGKKFLADCFYAAALPADAVSHHRREKHAARIEQRREDRTHVSKHQSREGDGRRMSGLLPSSHWQESGWAKGDGEGGIACLGKTEGGRDARKKTRRRRIRRAAHKIGTDARSRSRAGELVEGRYNVHTLAFKGTNGIGHAEVTLMTCEDAGCDIIGLQGVRHNGQSAYTVAGYVVVCSGADGGKHEKKGNRGIGFQSIVPGT